MPPYVANDLYNNRVGYTMRRILGTPALAPTTNYTRDETQKGTSSGASTIDRILGAHDYHKYQWTPKPIDLNLTPLDFDERTQNIFLTRRFGFRPEPMIRQDNQRMGTQLGLLSQRGPNNEPIIVVKRGNKYELLEGWHRAMNYLLYPPNPNIGAPPDQIEALQRNDLSKIDFSRWKPVAMRAYMGN